MSGIYTLIDYGLMTVDQPRMEPYVEALRRAVGPGSVVVDIGTGAGIFAIHACRFGARRVYAIEPDETIQVGREIAAANGYADRIEFIQRLSTDVRLPERADVIISDLRGVVPLYDHHLPSVIDARERFLAPGGVLIAERDSLWTALVDAPELRARHVEPWRNDDGGPDLRIGLRYTLNAWSKGRAKPEQLLAEPQSWGTLDYRTLTSPDLRGTASWVVERTGTAHGLNVWFDAQVLEGLSFSNAPGAPVQAYGALFFPLLEPVALLPGDTAEVTLFARHVGNDYTWGWNTRVLSQGRPEHVKADFRQHTFLGAVLSGDWLARSDRSFIPVLGAEAAVERLVIESMDGQTSTGQIADRLMACFPDRFRNSRDAVTYVAGLACRLSPQNDRAAR